MFVAFFSQTLHLQNEWLVVSSIPWVVLLPSTSGKLKVKIIGIPKPPNAIVSHLVPLCPLFFGIQPLQKKALYNQNKGHQRVPQCNSLVLTSLHMSEIFPPPNDFWPRSHSTNGGIFGTSQACDFFGESFSEVVESGGSGG